ncbi:MAG: hypothetical protein R3275_12890 [Saprospiraceae bacterium]|nr:hypothetical protein [Saprospiraceae bacterium]
MEIQKALRKTDTLSQATSMLQNAGYTTNFIAESECISSTDNNKKYKPEELEIEASCRFEGQSNPADSSEVLALRAKDGTKGTLVLSYGAQHSQDQALVRKIPFAENVARN